VLAAVLALLASFSWGTADFLAGVESRRSTAWTAALAGQAVACLSLIVLLAVVAPARPSLAAIVPAAAGGAVGAAGVLLQYRAFTLVDLSVVSPIIAGAALVPVLWGVAAGERPTLVQLLGVALTLTGIVLISRRAPGTSETRRADRAGVLMAVGSAIALGLFLVALDYGGEADPYWTVTVARTTALIALVIAAGISRPSVRLVRRAVPALLLMGLLIAAANILFTSATTLGYLSLVAVLGWLNPAITIAWARAVLHERLRPLQIGAAVLVFAGIVCITLG
jgi:drug/metabolite transporter (DMT)-like permease